MRRSFRPIAASLIAGTLAISVAACGSSSTGSSCTPAADVQRCVDEADPHRGELTGVETSVTLDPSCCRPSTSLNVTPAPTGTGTLTMPGGAATLNFPITGGNVTIYNKGAVTPYVQGIIHHDGSGVSLHRRRQDADGGELRHRPGQVAAERSGQADERRCHPAVLPRRQQPGSHASRS